MLSILLAAVLAAQPTPATRADAERLARAGAYAEALQQFREIVAADPADLEARLWIGRLHLWMHDPGRAEGVFRSVLGVAPDNVDALLGLGDALIALGRGDEAAAVLDRAETLAPSSAAVFAAQGRAHIVAGRTGLGIAYLERAVVADPRDAAVRRELERTRRRYDHRVNGAFVFERFDAPVDDTLSGDVSLDMRVNDRLRVLGRFQSQQKFGATETRGGAGAEWRPRYNAWVRGSVMAGLDTDILPDNDVAAEVGYIRGPAEISGLGQYVRFSDGSADMFIASPAVRYTVLPQLVVSARYARTVSSFGFMEGKVKGNAGLFAAEYQVHPRVWVQGGYARGLDRFDAITFDVLGDFRADTYSGGARLEFRSLTTAIARYDVQRRHVSTFNAFGDAPLADSDVVRVSVSITQRF
jgi:Tfp pilus assembly protein PilF